MRKPLDPDTHMRVYNAIERARRSGASIPVRLHEAQLLWTPERERAVRLEALRDLQNVFTEFMPHEFLRTINRELVGCTPTDMHRAIEKWINDYITHIRETE